MLNQKKFTLIRLLLIFLVIIIIFIVCIYSITNSYKLYNLNKYIVEMEEIQERVNVFRNEYKSWSEYNPNETGNFYSYMQKSKFVNASSQSNLYINEFKKIIEKINNENKEFWNKDIDSIITNYCYFTPETLENLLGVKNSKLCVIINFYTGNIISKDGIKNEDNELIYRQYDSKLGNELKINEIYYNNIIPQIEIVENKGLSQKVKISVDSDYDIAEIYYVFDNNNEEMYKCSNLSDYNYVKKDKTAYFTINISGDYKFVVEDTNSIQYPKITKTFNLCNPPVLVAGMKGIYWNGDEEKEILSTTDSNWYNYSYDELKMANAKTEDGNYWVWIPRFCFRETKEDIDVKYIFENSNTSTTNKVLTGYKLQEAFSENGNILGFWILKFQCSNENKILVEPGETLAMISKNKANSVCSNYINTQKAYSMLTTSNQLNSILMISNSENIKISNNLVHYSGGGPKELDYIENCQYSSTGNVYGVYDLITSENELVKEQKSSELGRYRVVIIPVQ